MQPRRPQVHCAPSILTTTWPSSPAGAAAVPGLAVEHDPAAHAGAPADAQHRLGPLGRAEHVLGVDRDIDVVVDVGAHVGSVFMPVAIGMGAPSPGRLPAPVTTPRRWSIAPGEPTPTPASSATSMPRVGARRAERGDQAEMTSWAPPVSGVGLRAWPITVRRPSRTTAWILVPPRSKPPTRRRRAGLMSPHSCPGSPGKGILGLTAPRFGGLRGRLERAAEPLRGRRRRVNPR